MMNRFIDALAGLKNDDLYRTLNTVTLPQDRETIINGRRVLLFSSNSYLGLAADPAIREKVIAAMAEFGTGAGGSRLVTGNLALHETLESMLASFQGTGDALVFTSGYTANVGVISAVCDKDSVVFSDALNHASIIDGCRLSRARVIVYAHNDPEDLEARIRAAGPCKGLIVTDGVFSMDGDIARLPDLVRISRENNLLLMVDDAHATGVLGATGKGSLEHFGLPSECVDILMGTLSKAIPSEGGYICGSEKLCDFLKNTARSFIYTTALAPMSTAAAIGGVEHLRTRPETVQRLQANIRYFTRRLEEEGIRQGGETAIIPVLAGSEADARAASEKLFALGIYVPCIRYPTVAKGQARLRFTVMASHTHDDMEYAVNCLKKILPRERIWA